MLFYNMDVSTLCIFLIVLGAVLLIIEANTPGVYLIIPGTICVILGIIGYFIPDALTTIYAPIIVLAIGLPVTYGTIKLYAYLGEPIPPSTSVSDALLGKEGVVTVATSRTNIKGKVKIDLETWSATSDEDLEVGTKVVVERTEGVHVVVKKKGE